jgi:murein DD-endopeptidase
MPVFKLLILFLCLPLPALAQSAVPKPVVKIVREAPKPPPAFQLPINCTLGKECWVLNYPDRGPENDGKATDSACFARTYEGHKGTDIAILDGIAMERGVDVLAAAAGTVQRLRDGEADRWPTPADIEEVKKAKKECGNGIFIDHGDGWQTIYCHLKNGSVSVKPGQTVKAGDKIGQVGLSGMTEFPHIHLGITHDGHVMDPFTGTNVSEDCTKTGTPLWDASLKMAYEPMAFFTLGFDTAPPDLSAINKQSAAKSVIQKDAPALIFHAVLLGGRQGDRATVSIIAPDGSVFARSTTTAEKNRAQQMYYVGRKIPNGAPLAPGNYKGTIQIVRTGADGKEEKFADEKIIEVQ